MYRMLVEESPTGQVAIGLDGTVLLANRRTRELCGLDRMPDGRHLIDFIVPNERAGVREHFGEACAGGSPRFESELLQADGSVITVGVTLYPMRRGGEIAAVGARVHDRTYLREAEQRRTENQQSLRLRQLYLVAASAGRTPAAAGPSDAGLGQSAAAL